VLPEPIACLNCGFSRTLRVGSKRVCFQCRFNWPLKLSPAVPAATTLVANEGASFHSFTSAELVRLGIYRNAVQAGFYTDFPRKSLRRLSPEGQPSASTPA
jgi:hypothetical protein